MKVTLCIMIMLLTAFVDGKRSSRTPAIVSINPPGLFDPTPSGFSHIRVDTRNGVAYISGQVALNANRSIVGTTLEEQLEVTTDNIKIALEAIGSSISDILAIGFYVKNYNPSTDIGLVRQTNLVLGSPALTIISTPSLALDPLLVEIDVKALVSRKFIRRKYLSVHKYKY